MKSTYVLYNVHAFVRFAFFIGIFVVCFIGPDHIFE